MWKNNVSRLASMQEDQGPRNIRRVNLKYTHYYTHGTLTRHKRENKYSTVHPQSVSGFSRTLAWGKLNVVVSSWCIPLQYYCVYPCSSLWHCSRRSYFAGKYHSKYPYQHHPSRPYSLHSRYPPVDKANR